MVIRKPRSCNSGVFISFVLFTHNCYNQLYGRYYYMTMTALATDTMQVQGNFVIISQEVYYKKDAP